MSNFDKHSMEYLDVQQYDAVTTNQKHVAVIAGAGSGKTRCLTERIPYLLSTGVPAEDIVAITFTNLAAEEMKMRLSHLNIEETFIGTIHSYANSILKSFGINFEVVKQNPETFSRMLEETMPLLQYLEPKHVLVDEFQDIGPDEASLIFGMKRAGSFFVGDDWQAIYGFKGGDVTYFKNLIDNPNFYKVYLTNNYRNGSQILIEASKEIHKARSILKKEINVKTEHSGRVIKEDIYGSIGRIAKGHYGDWAILCRTNKELVGIRMALEDRHIPYVGFRQGETTLETLDEVMNQDTVKVLTIHSAKGLEFRNVIVHGMRYWDDDEIKINYVALTRPTHILCIT